MKTIYAEAQPGKVVLKEKEIPAPGKGEVSDMRWQQKSLRLVKVWRT